MALSIIGTPAALAATSITLPTHAVGDIIVIYAYRGASTTTPTKPSAAGTVPAWVDVDNTTGANSNSSRVAYFVATATNHTSGTWTNATDLAVIVLRGQAASPIGGHAESGSSGTTLTAPSVTLTKTDGSSVLLHFYGVAAITAWGSAPTGYTRRAAETAIAVDGTTGVCLNTKDSTTSDGSVSQSATIGTTAYRGASVEVLALTATALTPAGVALPLTGSAPTVLSPRLVTPTAVTLAVTGSVATVTASDQRTVTPAGATLLLIGGLSGILTPAAAVLTLVGSAPTLLMADHKTITPAGCVLVLGSGNDHRVIHPGPVGQSLPAVLPFVLGAVTLTGYAPVVTITLPVGGATLTLTGGTPSVASPRVVSPAPAELTVTGQPPHLGTGLRPDAVVLTLIGHTQTATGALRPAPAVFTVIGGVPFVGAPIKPAGAMFVLTGRPPRVGSFGGDSHPHEGRVLTVPPDNRLLYVCAETRRSVVAPDDRVLTLTQE